MDNIKRKQTERIDTSKQVQYDKFDGHKDRIRAHEKRVKREYFGMVPKLKKAFE